MEMVSARPFGDYKLRLEEPHGAARGRKRLGARQLGSEGVEQTPA